MRRVVVSSLLLAAFLAACAPVPGTKVPSTRKSTGPGTTPVMQPSVGPDTSGGGLVSAGGGNVVSNNAGNLIGKVKAPASLISDKGVGVVSNGTGNLVSNNGGSYTVLAAPEQVVLAGATVRLVDATGAVLKDSAGKELTTVSDGQGNYGFQTALPTQNLVVEVLLPADKGAIRAVVPREGTGKKTVDLDLVSTLTTSYILNQYVQTQKDPLATFEKLPANVEAVTRERAQTALAGGAAAVPEDLTSGKVVATVDAMRAKDAGFNAQMEEVKKLLVVAGASDLGTGLKATEVTIKDVNDLEFAPDGSYYILTTEDRRVWRVRTDGVMETAIGNRGTVSGQDLTGQLGTEANLDRPVAIGLDGQGRLLVSEARGIFRLGTDGKLTRLTTRTGNEFAAGKDDEVIVSVTESRPLTEDEELIEDFPEAMRPKQYGLYRCKPGAEPVRVYEIIQDPYDDGSQSQWVTGLSWDGGNTLYVSVNNNSIGKQQLLKVDLTTKTGATDAGTPDGNVLLDGTGHVFDWTTGQVRVRSLFQAAAEKTVPVPPQWTSRLAMAPDGRVYAAKWGMVFRLDPSGPVRVAGTEGQGSGGNAGTFTFEVLVCSTVTPDGTVFALDTGKGAIYKVGADRQLTKLADSGRGNVQLIRSAPDGTIYMSDGNGNGLGKFDAAGNWTQVGTTQGMIVDYTVAADGTIYASTAVIQGERQYQLVQVKNGVETVLETGVPGALVALDKAGVLHMATGGTLKKRDGSGWKVLKTDERFNNAYYLGGGAGMAIDGKGRVYLTVPDQNKILRYSPSADTFETIAGAGSAHFAGSGTDDGINKPKSPAFDAAGNLYFADFGNRQVKRIAADGLQ